MPSISSVTSFLFSVIKVAGSQFLPFLPLARLDLRKKLLSVALSEQTFIGCSTFRQNMPSFTCHQEGGESVLEGRGSSDVPEITPKGHLSHHSNGSMNIFGSTFSVTGGDLE